MANEAANDATQLLLYLCGELDEPARARIDEQLARDPALRAQLQQLRAAQVQVVGAMKELEAGAPLSEAHLAATVRQTTRAMRQWQLRRLAAAPAPTADTTWRLDWRGYSVAAVAAAIIAIGAFVWWDSDNAHTIIEPGMRSMADADNADDDAENPAIDTYASTFEQTLLPPTARTDDFTPVENEMNNLRSITELSRSSNSDAELQ